MTITETTGRLKKQNRTSDTHNDYRSSTDEYQFASSHADVSVSITEYIKKDDSDGPGRDFVHTTIHIGDTDDSTQVRSFHLVEHGRWSLNIGPVTLFVTPDIRRRIIDALIDGEDR